MVLDELFNNRNEKIIESVLDLHSAEVATTISGYIAKRLIKRSKCEECKAFLMVHDTDLGNDSYLPSYREVDYLFLQKYLQNSFVVLLRF